MAYTKRRVRRSLRRVGIACLGLTLMLGSAGILAGPAQAKAIYASLYIDQNPQPGTSRYLTKLNIWIPMSAAEARTTYNNFAQITVTFWPDDNSGTIRTLKVFGSSANGATDQINFYRNATGYTAESDGLHVRYQFLARGAALNEDDGWVNTRDEIFFDAALIRKGVPNIGDRSNIVTGYFRD